MPIAYYMEVTEKDIILYRFQRNPTHNTIEVDEDHYTFMHISRDDFQNTLTVIFDTLAHAFFKIMLDVHD